MFPEEAEQGFTPCIAAGLGAAPHFNRECIQGVDVMRRFKIFGIVNIFDVFLVVVCIAIVYAAYLFSMPQQAIAESGTRIRFTVELNDFMRGHDAGFYRQIEAGPVVFESGRGVPIGYVVYAYSLPFMQEVADEANNIFRRVLVEEREFTYIVIESWANVTDLETEVNQIRIAVNQDIYVRSRDFAGRGFITHLEFLD